MMNMKQQIDLIEAKIAKLNELKPGENKVLNQFAKFAGAKPGYKSYSKLMAELAQIKKDIEYHKKQLAIRLKQDASLEKKINKIPKNKRDDVKSETTKILDYIQKHCGDYLKEMIKTDKLLYRGTTIPGSPNVFVGRSWENREPTDSSAREQVIFDKFLEKLGIEARRGNSIFTGAADHAEGYGNQLYLIFPKNSAKFSWSQHKSDLVLHSGDLSDYCEKDTKQINKLGKVWEKNIDAMIKIRNQYENKDKLTKKEEKIYGNITDIQENLEGALYELDGYTISDVKYEITRGLKLEILKPIMNNFTKLLDQYEKLPDEYDLKSFQSNYRMSDKNFAKALNSENEICISGEYVAVNLKKSGTDLAELIGIDLDVY